MTIQTLSEELELKNVEKAGNVYRFNDRDDWRWYAKDESPENWKLSVTTVLNPIVHDKLKKWFVNTPATKQQETKDKTAAIGTMLHKAIENDLRGDNVVLDGTIEAAQAFDNWLAIKELHKIQPLYLEQSLESETLGLAGSTDCIGSFNGKLCVIDFKTGFFSVKAGWQIALYKLMAEEMGLGENLGMVGIQIHRDGKVAKPFEYEHLRFCLQKGLSALEIFKGLYFHKLNKAKWRWLHTDAMEVLYSPKGAASWDGKP